MKTIRLTLAATLCCSVAIPATTAFAQVNTEEDEIIVMATKRASSVQDVPISVTVVTPVQLENQGVKSIKDLESVASGFNIQSSQTETQGTSIRIRGVGTTGNNIGLESSVGVFIDGVYQSRPGVALGELADIQSLELLRGPQGTLFGRNTSAGALNIMTKKPDFDGTSGYADFTYGNYNLINVKGGVNFTASDQLAFRFNGALRNRNGFMTSSVNPAFESHDKDRFLIKGQALWEPSDDTAFRLIVDYSEIDEKCCAAVTLTTSPNHTPASRAALFPVVGFEDALEEQIFNDQEWANGSDSFGVSGELKHNFGNIEMTAIGSYRDYTAFSTQQDFNASQQYSVPALSDDIETITAELRFQGEAADGRLDWLIGGFYADEDIQERFALTLGPDYSTSVAQANFGNPAFLGFISGAGSVVQQALLAGNPMPVFAPVSSNGAFADNQFNQEATSFSVFTHNIFSVTDRLDLTLGARYNDDQKDGRFNQLSAQNDACISSLTLAGGLGAGGATTGAVVATLQANLPAALIPAVTGAGVGPGAFINCFPFASPTLGSIPATNPFAQGAGAALLPREFDESFEDDEFIYTAKLDYDVTDDLLIYGGFSHGYKAGGFNLDASAGQGGASPQFQSETIDSWEAGFKSTLADGRVRFNVTGFWSTMDNFQVLEFTGTQFTTFNVDDVSSKGVEVEVNARLSDYFDLNAGVTYADAGYGDNCDRNGTITPAITLCGFSLTNAPELTSVLGMTYDGPLSDTGGGLLANVNLSTSTDRRTSTQPQTAVGVLNPLDVQAGVTKVNARLGFTLPNERASIEFWGLNLTDEITRSITFNTPLQGASRSAFLAPPRQYGVTVRTNF